MRYLYNPSTDTLDDIEDKNFLNKLNFKFNNIDDVSLDDTKDKNIKVASETPLEEAEMLLGSEAIEFMKWLKKNPNKTYNDWLKDKTALLTEDQKKDPKIIDLTPYIPSFEEEIKEYEKEKKQKDETTLEEFTKRRLRLMAEKDLNSGISSLTPLRKI